MGFDQVRGRDCKGISGALVEVWYAGGEPGLQNVFHEMLGGPWELRKCKIYLNCKVFWKPVMIEWNLMRGLPFTDRW